MSDRFLGIDLGAETLKVVELTRQGEALGWTRRALVEHHKDPAPHLRALLAEWRWNEVSAAAVSGRLGRQVDLPRVPAKQAQARASRFLFGQRPATLVSIGSHGFSVLELRDNGTEVFRENGRCSQGTGNFLRQLVERFDLDIEEASRLCAEVPDPAPLSGRCPVILKTDMTHLANKGENRGRILAGLFDAVCENVQVLLKPRLSPPDVVLLGGVFRAPRLRANFRRFADRHDLRIVATDGDDALFFEALGSALIAAEQPRPVASLDELLKHAEAASLEQVPALSGYLSRVRRMRAPPMPADPGAGAGVVLGFDIGSTGSKAVALDAKTKEPIWEGYLRTGGDPVAAAQRLMRQFVDSPASQRPLVAIGATGSGREIVGSLMSSCYGAESVFVLNEIAAHAEGATHFDPRVDTIFEIGGQDAKYVRLAHGRVVDAAMNEACSAGTGSFIEEQGSKFQGIDGVVQLGTEAVAAKSGVSLGQHCSVFMAEIIDEAVATGVERESIVAGIYDSIVQNYLNRVKGSRSVGQVVFCQGMPFAADALAAAVVRQTGSEVIVPPNPGTVGALGIALLAHKELGALDRKILDPQVFLTAKVERKDTFVCRSRTGCGGSGNLCRIDRITTRVLGQKGRFTWGGGCSVWDKGTRRQKLPDLAPDPFREREELIAELVAEVGEPRGNRTIALTDEFQLKALFPFFATFLHRLGFDLKITRGADHRLLKRGIEEANVPFCAPMQQFHGLVSTMAEQKPDYLFLPMIRSIPRAGDEPHSVVCPIVQGSPDMLKADLGTSAPKILSPVIDMGVGNFQSRELREGCRELAESLGVPEERWQDAFVQAAAAQESFDAACLDIGQRALDFCAERGIVPVVVLGRAYTIYNTVLNSNVPAILREQGALAIPVDCYPVSSEVPVFHDMYWAFGQKNLRAAQQIRLAPGVYSIYCSNYSCGPDSFTLGFYGYVMEGKPFAIIETDGHSGDAGTKTRVEAFLHCVKGDLAGDLAPRPANSFKAIELDKQTLPGARRDDELVLIPWIGPSSDATAAALRGVGVRAEALPLATRETVRVGRRYTSGKECVPMTVTLGALLQRLEKERDSKERFAFLMPTAGGPCRFGVYNLLHKITLERLGWKDRARVWSPSDSNYFEGVPQGTSVLIFAGMMAADLLLEALYHVRPVEARSGAAEAVYQKHAGELHELLEDAGHGDLSVTAALSQVATGHLFGVMELLDQAARDFAAIKTAKELPTVLVVGEIYVRCDDFSNDFVVQKLEARGLRVRFAPFTEWLEYTEYVNFLEGTGTGFGAIVSRFVQSLIQATTYAAVARQLGWPSRTTVPQILKAAAPYMREDLVGEAVLTLGGPVHEWREGRIDGVVSVGPLECMPNKIAEAQFFHVAEREGLRSLTVPLNGDPIDPEVIDNFAFEIRAAWQRARSGAREAPETSEAKSEKRPRFPIRMPLL